MSKSSFLKDEKFVGGFVPRLLSDKLALMAISTNHTKSALLKLILERSIVGKPSIEKIMDDIAILYYNNNPLTNFPKFKTLLASILQNKKIQIQYINYILEKVNQLHAKKKTK